MVQLAVKRGEGLWVAGPARVYVREGELLASGFTLGAGEEAIVRGARGFTFYALSDSHVDLTLGSGAAYSVVREGFEVVENWLKVLEELEAKGARRIVVIGPPESGKSTFTVWARNRLGLHVIEADVGQNELGTPGFVSLSKYKGEKVLALNDLHFDKAFFVGHVSADRVLDAVIAATRRAASYCRDGFIVDTDGYVEGRGAIYKAHLISVLDADFVVAMDETIARLIKPLHPDVIVARKPILARERSRVDRRIFRQRLYAMLFADSKIIVLKGVNLANICPHTVEGESIVYRCPRIRVVEGRAQSGGVRLRPGWYRGLLAAIRGREGDIPALVETLNLSEPRIALRVPKVMLGELNRLNEKETTVLLGWVRLSENYLEEQLEVNLHPLPLVKGASYRPRGKQR